MFSNPLILVGTDFSPASEFAVRAGEVLRRKTNGRMHVVHVMQNAWELNYIPEVTKNELMKAYNVLLSEQVQRCEAACTTELIPGRPYKALNEMIESKGADVLVLGHRGSGDDQFHVGGLTTKMVSTAQAPVLIVSKPLQINKIAGVVDPSDPILNIFSVAEEFSWLFSTELEFISLWQDISAQNARRSPYIKDTHVQYSEEEKNKILNEMRLTIRVNIKDDPRTKIRVGLTDQKNIAEALVKIMEEERVDLGVLSRHQKSLVEKILIGSVTKRVIDLFRGNLLILPPYKE